MFPAYPRHVMRLLQANGMDCMDGWMECIRCESLPATLWCEKRSHGRGIMIVIIMLIHNIETWIIPFPVELSGFHSGYSQHHHPSLMAKLLRTAKSGSDWTAHELNAYNIVVVSQNEVEFFGTADLPVPTDPSLSGFLKNECRQTAMDKKTKQLIHHLDLAMNPKIGMEAAVDDFVAVLLRHLAYDRDGIVLSRHVLPLVICGEDSTAQTDICIVDEEDIVLLVQENKRRGSTRDPEPQVIAQAIAAFEANNTRLERGLHRLRREAMMFPAMTMVGTSPTFYRVAVTSSLSKSVQTGTYPELETRVLRYRPILRDGMGRLRDRLTVLQCLEAFKRFLGN
jgi:hypothetical protein